VKNINKSEIKTRCLLYVTDNIIILLTDIVFKKADMKISAIILKRSL